jgi:hypothetical protein
MNFDEEIYKKKYLKYKAKYLELKGGADYSGTWNKEGIYSGSITSDLFSKKRDGKGKMTYLDNTIYEGNWSNDKRTGKGKMTYADTSTYDGYWVNDKRVGEGLMTYADKSTFNGEWVNDKREGKGTYITNKPISVVEEYEVTKGKTKVKETRTIEKIEITKYEGDWKDDKRTGKGKMTYVDNSIYDGDWINDKRTGKGKMINADKSEYNGDWVDDKYNGKGKMIYVDKYTYEGDWKDGKREGIGKYILSTSEKEYIYTHQKCSGSGSRRKCTNQYDTKNVLREIIYEGEWKNNMKDGKGKLTDNLKSNPVNREGNWKEDKPI